MHNVRTDNRDNNRNNKREYHPAKEWKNSSRFLVLFFNNACLLSMSVKVQVKL